MKNFNPKSPSVRPEENEIVIALDGSPEVHELITGHFAAAHLDQGECVVDWAADDHCVKWSEIISWRSHAELLDFMTLRA
jgi:hypothetical protein